MKFKLLLCLLVLCAMCLQMTACSKDPQPQILPPQTIQLVQGTVDLMQNVTPLAVQMQPIQPSYVLSAAEFSLELLKNTYAGENCILSPYSVYAALAMCANGADAQTLEQMEQILGMSSAELNVYLYSLTQGAGQELQSANSIWFRNANGFAPKADFLQIIADYYGANLFAADFDEKTLQEINAWIYENTNGRIEHALEQIDPLTMMYLINALSFNARWQEEYYSEQVWDGVFHSTQGEQSVQMMDSEEHKFLNDGNATGFLKDYAGGQYSFMALLPNEGVEMAEYLSTLTGEKLLATVQNATNVTVMASMPKCELRYKNDLKEILAAMGMPNAFGDEADFSRMSNLELKIGQVLHQAYLKVDELGTEAGASTIVAMDTKGAFLNIEYVMLDRPFVMGIYDNVNQCFAFMGVVESVA